VAKKKKKPNVPEIPTGHQLTNKAKVGLIAEEKRIQNTYREYSKKDFLIFTRGLKIDSDKGPQVFERCLYPFQREVFEDLAPNLEALRKGDEPEKKRFWIERTKKAGKDSDLAIIILWLIAFPKRPFYIQVGAADKEQASIVKKRITHLLEFNSWLTDYVEIVQWEVRSKQKLADGSPKAHLQIMSSDISAAHGGTPDLLIINELSHVRKWEFAENLMDNAAGVPRGMVIIATNAGFKGTKAEVWRNIAIGSDDWMFFKWEQPAPWHSTEFVQDAKKRNTKARYNRLWRGIWASGKGDALDEDDIEDCFLTNDKPHEGPIFPEKGWIYVGGLDLGITNDRSGLVILGIDIEERKIKIVYWEKWEPDPKTGEVNLKQVEAVCLQKSRRYLIQAFYYDPTEARLMAQRLRSQVPMIQMTFAPKNLNIMAESLIQAVESGILKCYDDKEGTLRRDFGKFNIVEKNYGYRLDAVRDEYGHADVGTALVICLPRAIAYLDGKIGLGPDDDLVDPNEEELSEEEIEDLPDEIKGIFEMYDEMDEEQLFEKDWDTLK